MAIYLSTETLLVNKFIYKTFAKHNSKRLIFVLEVTSSSKEFKTSPLCKMSISNGIKKARSTIATIIGTHNGTFHCDEVLACFMLKQLPQYQNAEIIRSRDVKQLLEKCDVIVDVGGIFDHKRKLYDHHQKTFQETMSSLNTDFGNEFNIRLSSAGLIYNYYGREIIKCILKKHKNVELSEEHLSLCFKIIYRKFIMEIDAIDNGVPMFENGEPLYKISTHLSARIGHFNPSWDEENVNIEERFQNAIAAAGLEFTQCVIDIGSSWINAREHVRKAIENSKSIHESGEILFLEKFCPWKLHLSELEKEYGIDGIPKLVIFSENHKSWRVAGVPVAPDSFVGRKFLPPAWRGLNDKMLSDVASIPNLIFVHHSGFIGGAKTKEAAIAMAIKSITMTEQN